MKNIFKLMLLLLLVFPFQACSDDDDASVTSLEVTPNNISGVWQLHKWSVSDDALPCVYIEFVRKDRKFKIYQDYGTMYPEIKTGTYEIEKDYYKGTILKGKYDNDNGKWNNEYVVTLLTEDILELVGGEETQTFVRVSGVPTDILDNIPEMEEKH